MSLKNFRFNPLLILEDEQAWDELHKVAGKISREANNATSAKVGITYNDVGSGKDRRVVIGARGAAAYPVELGTAKLAAKRFFKRSLGKFREG